MLREAIAEDLKALGELAARATSYVTTGSDDDVLHRVVGHGKALQLATIHGWGEPRAVLARFADGDEGPLERLGRLYAAAAANGHIAELGGDLAWVEHLVWEAGQNSPNTFSAPRSNVRLELLERRMKDPAPLLRAMLVASTDKAAFTRSAWANNALGAPDAASLFVRNKAYVEEILREGHVEAITRLDDAKTPVAPFALTLAELAADPRVTLRRPALKFLARDPEAARAALRHIAGDDDRKTKQRELAEKALEMIGVEPDAVRDCAPTHVPPLSAVAREKLRALCDEWHAQAAPKLAAHVARYPAAPSSWAEAIDDATFERICELVSASAPWGSTPEALLSRLSAFVVGIDAQRIREVLADAAFEPAHVVRLQALIATHEWHFFQGVFDVFSRRGDSLDDVRAAVATTWMDPGLVDRHVLEGTGWGDETDAAYLAAHQEVIEVVLGARAATWFEPRSYLADGLRARAFKRLLAMDRSAVSQPVREALWDVALRGGKTERPRAQACLVHFGDHDKRLVAALSDGSAEVRANAASWIARLKLDARPELRKALAKERNDQARVAIMGALEAAGEPLDALMNREGLRANATVTLGKIKCPVLDWSEAAKLPAMHWADTGKAVDHDIARAWIAETFKGKSPAPSPLLRMYARTIVKDEREAFACALLDAWIAHDTESQSEWDGSTGAYTAMSSAIGEKGVLALVAAFGGAGIAERVAAFLKTYYGNRAAQCKALLQMLAHTGDKSAVQLLLATATRFRTAGIRAEAEAQSKALAERRGWTVDEMADRTIPTGGLEDDGSLELAYGEGGRAFVVRLDPALRVTLHTKDGAPLKAMPAPHKDEDEAAAKAAKTALSRAKKEIESVVKMQRNRLYEAMCTQRTWRFEDWDALLAKHPIVKHLVSGVVWVAKDGDEETSFRPIGDGSLSTAKHRDVKPAPNALVRVAHPLTVHDSHITDWTEHLGDFEVLPLFAQFGRATHTVDEASAKKTECGDFVGHMIEAFKLRGRATGLGYVRGPSEDGGWFYRYVKVFPSLGLQAVLGFSGNGMPEENRTVALGAFSFERTGEERGSIPLGEVPPVLFSEIWSDVQDVARDGTGFDPAWESKVR